MVQANRRRAGLAALASLLLGGGPVMAQEVQIFEEAPPLELLRSIMVPESRPGASRGFVPGGAPQSRPMARETAATVPAGFGALPEERGRLPAGSGPQPETACNAPTLLAAMPAVAPAAPASIGFRINFALDSDVVPPSAFPMLDRIGELMRDQPRLTLEVEGHTDASGPDVYNLLLSQRRAASVARYLVQRQGVDMARLVVLGMGESAPLFANGYDPRNRRVQFARLE